MPVNLPTRNDLAPDPITGVYVGEFLALQILAPDVRVPVANDPGAIAGGFFPAWQLGGEERAGVYGQTGGAILFNGDWTPTGGADGAGIIPGFAVGQFATGALPIQVPGPGILRVTDGALGRAAALGTAAKKRSRVIPVVRKVSEAGTVNVRIRPSKTGKRKLRRTGKLRLSLRIAFTPEGSQTPATKTAKVTLKRRK